MHRSTVHVQPKPRPWIGRFGSSILILATFLTPWTPDHFGDHLGVRVVTWLGAGGWVDLTRGRMESGLVNLGFFAGFLCLLLYSLWSITAAISRPPQQPRSGRTRARRALLGAGTAAWLGAWAMSGFDIGNFLWGYGSLGAAILLAGFVEWNGWRTADLRPRLVRNRWPPAS